MKKTLLDKLEDKILIDDGCWIWTGALFPNGYGHLRHEGRDCLAHRVVYELLVGPIPAGLDLDHVKERGCVSRACTRPYHLEPVTRQVNIKRGKTGSKTHCSKGHSLANALSHHGRRECRECNRLSCAKRYTEKRHKRGMYKET